MDELNEKLAESIRRGDMAGFERLLPRCEPLARDEEDSTQLMRAAAWGRADMLARLIPRSFCAVKNNEGKSALMLACAYARLDCALMLAPVSDANARDERGLTALMMAARADFTAGVEALMGRADVDLKNNEGHTALACAVIAGSEGCSRVLARVSRDTVGRPALGKTGCGPEGQTALMLAAELDQWRCAQALEPYADWSARDALGRSADTVAEQLGSERIKMLFRFWKAKRDFENGPS